MKEENKEFPKELQDIVTGIIRSVGKLKVLNYPIRIKAVMCEESDYDFSVVPSIFEQHKIDFVNKNLHMFNFALAPISSGYKSDKV
ncbi:hypothetical protein [Flavobacterium limnophilum]|uniref:hypothetical protein n=1 Tax=Flavobacterium limnophilum TaxID=3003262 RepID=UPI0022AC2CA9|nr:hypothetical protein [Flavobacterium limnophilum]